MNPLVYVIAFLVVLLLIRLAVKFWPTSDQQHFDSHYQKFVSDNRHVPFADVQEEIAVRYVLAAVRRRATDEVLNDPENFHTIISRVLKEEGLLLVKRDRQLGRKFLAWGAKASVSEILYPSALGMVEALAFKKGRALQAAITSDDLAVFKTF